MTPMNNPTVTLTMSLETFNDIQRVLGRQPFEEVADTLLTFKHQVQGQLDALAREQAAQMLPPAPRPHLVPDAEAGC
jgi:hypothetical protein